jgi:hypothetical protein
MSQVIVVAMQSFAYKGRAVYEGEAVEMPAIDAAVEGRKGHVSLDPATKATYHRRDMVAESSFIAPSVPAHVESVKPPIIKRRRGRPRKKVIS